MKSTAILAAAAPFLPFTSALVGWGWSVENIPGDGLKDIAFPMGIPHAQHETGYYFAQQFRFKNLKDLGYTGLQPRENVNGSSIIHGVFSSFVAGTTSDDKNCHQGADGGPGLSCAVEFPAPYDHPYNIYVKNTQGTTWTGTIIDRLNGNMTHIGSFTLPSHAGGIEDGSLGFIEDYAGHDCAKLPYTNISIGEPLTTAPGAKGNLDDPYEYGDCEGQVNFDFTEFPNGGYQVSCGFK
ncbi:hypothetical protein PHISP_03518 [Aspergillus sp. HF37]|nr:hypothetical protein PHISP_03518 [Aspergillus sp. HF37]